jgi:hypothetical protein
LPSVKKLKTIALKASKKMVEVSSGDDFEDEGKAVGMLAKNFRRLMRNERYRKKFFGKIKKVPEKLNLRKPRRKIPGAQDVMNAQGLGISGPIVGISSKVRGRLITRLSVMSPKKKKLLSKRNF